MVKILELLLQISNKSETGNQNIGIEVKIKNLVQNSVDSKGFKYYFVSNKDIITADSPLKCLVTNQIMGHVFKEPLHLQIKAESTNPMLWAHNGVTWVCLLYPCNSVNKGVYIILLLIYYQKCNEYKNMMNYA